MRPVRLLRLRYCAAPGSRRFVLESVSARADGARRSRRGDWLGFRARSLCSRVSGFAAAPFRNSARERGERPPKSNGRPSLSGRRRVVHGPCSCVRPLRWGVAPALAIAEEPNDDTRLGVRAVAQGCGTNSQPGSNRDGKMPKPADLSVLGLRPNNDFTPTRSLSTRMHDLPGTGAARAVLVALPPKGDSPPRR